MPTLRRPLGALALVLLSACGGQARQVLDPQAPEYDAENKARCRAGMPTLKPLVVEWPTTQRAELEALVQGAVVPVRYENCKLEVLSSCQAPSQYHYTPVTPKSDRVSIKNLDDLYANIPIYAVDFEAKLQRAGELTVNLTAVGQFETGERRIGIEDLEGNCAGATHFVRAFVVGAFDFFAGASSNLSGKVGVAGMGTGGARERHNETLLRDGNREACQKSKPDDQGPPFGCGALLRLDLLPLGDAARLGDPPQEGTVRNPYRKDNVVALEEACTKKRHAESCAVLGELHERGLGVNHDLERAAKLQEQACNLGSMDGCALFGDLLLSGKSGKKEPERGATLVRRACEGKSAGGCYYLSALYRSGTGVSRDLKRHEALQREAFSLAKAACKGGDASYCSFLAFLYLGGSGVPQNAERGEAHLRQACEAGYAPACQDLAESIRAGRIPGSNADAQAELMRGCELGDALCCLAAASDVQHSDVALARGLWTRACESGVAQACHRLARSYRGESGEDRQKAAPLLRRACDLGLKDACREADAGQ